ncbi:MAG: hypothetical protein WA862_01760 [Solirubrobacterales bacterium]
MQLLWALAGFIAEPSFSLGADAPTERVLGVDFNGYHGLAGLLLFGLAFYFALRSTRPGHRGSDRARPTRGALTVI